MAPAETPIPQYPLCNAAGRPVRFDLHTWGTAGGYEADHAHRHQFHEILVFENGSAAHDIDFETYQARPRSVHFVASDNVHLMVRQPGARGYSLMFTKDYAAADLLARLPFARLRPVLQLTPADYKMLQSLVGQIRAAGSASRLYADEIIHALVQAILLLLADSTSHQYPEAAPGAVPEAVQQFRQLVQLHYTEHLSVGTYAARLCVSPKHLIALSKRYLGKTPLKYIQDYMVCEARRLLYHTNMPVKEIAYRLNFGEPADFSKYFKACTGYAPAAYRKDGR